MCAGRQAALAGQGLAGTDGDVNALRLFSLNVAADRARSCELGTVEADPEETAAIARRLMRMGPMTRDRFDAVGHPQGAV